MERFVPMLAVPYKPKLTKFPVIVQPKFNGYRCLLSADDCWTRGLKDHNPDLVWGMFQHIQDEIPRAWAIDGEIYCHGLPLQEIISLGKDWRLESTCLQLVAYDLFIASEPNLPFTERIDKLKSFLEFENGSRITLSPGNLMYSDEDVQVAIEHWGKLGYEGAIIRQPGSPYHFDRKGRDLQKAKKWEDAEWVVLEITEGERKYEGCPVFHCQSVTGKPFKVCINADYRELRKLWRNRKHLIGKQITVKYNGLTKDQVPIAARGVAIRDYE